MDEFDICSKAAFYGGDYMYRGCSLKEIQNIINGGESGGFWSDYCDFSYGSGGFLVAKYKGPKWAIRFKGEIPIRFHLKLKDIERIYVRTNDITGIGIGLVPLKLYLHEDLIRAYPSLSKNDFKEACKNVQGCLEEVDKMYSDYINALKKYGIYIENIDSNLLGITILAGAILFLWLIRRKVY